jgi:hypothetical protein
MWWSRRNNNSNADLQNYGRRAAEAMDAALVLDASIEGLIRSETNQVSRDDITRVRILALTHKEKFVTQVAEIYASVYNLDELKALVTFLENPAGKSIRKKQLEGAAYSLDERNALAALLESPAGQAMREKQSDVEGRINQAVTAFLESIMK